MMGHRLALTIIVTDSGTQIGIPATGRADIPQRKRTTPGERDEPPSGDDPNSYFASFGQFGGADELGVLLITEVRAR